MYMYLSTDIPESGHVILGVPKLNVVGMVKGEQDLAGIEWKVGQGGMLH